MPARGANGFTVFELLLVLVLLGILSVMAGPALSDLPSARTERQVGAVLDRVAADQRHHHRAHHHYATSLKELYGSSGPTVVRGLELTLTGEGPDRYLLEARVTAGERSDGGCVLAVGPQPDDRTYRCNLRPAR